MFEFTRAWAEDMIVRALVARGIPEDEAERMADMGDFIRVAHEMAWGEGFTAGREADHNSMWWPKNPYREGAK